MKVTLSFSKKKFSIKIIEIDIDNSIIEKAIRCILVFIQPPPPPPTTTTQEHHYDHQNYHRYPPQYHSLLWPHLQSCPKSCSKHIKKSLFNATDLFETSRRKVMKLV